MQANYTERETTGGYTIGEIEVEGKKVIVYIQASPSVYFCICDRVVPNGRYLPLHPKGARGQVTMIKEPYTCGRTSNVIVVVWEDGSRVHMKFEDIILEPCLNTAVMENPVKA